MQPVINPLIEFQHAATVVGRTIQNSTATRNGMIWQMQQIQQVMLSVQNVNKKGISERNVQKGPSLVSRPLLHTLLQPGRALVCQLMLCLGAQRLLAILLAYTSIL